MLGTPDFAHWANSHQQRIEAQLQAVLPNSEVAPQRLHEAMRYAVLGGGKRVRPLLALCRGRNRRRRCPSASPIAGAAVELIHAYSLVHDDLPCMDDDVLRRGKPTCHVEFDEATALLVGDALQSLAFQLLGRAPARGRSGGAARDGASCSPPHRARAAWPADRRSISRASARR